MAKDFRLEFDLGTIKHLGLQMYSTLPPVVAELVSNAWDAEATRVEVTIPAGHLVQGTCIIVSDNGSGMTDSQVRDAYLVVGRDRREEDRTDISGEMNRPVMGRKGIGKFSAFGIAAEMELETVSGGQTSRFILNYEELKKNVKNREISMPPLPPTGEVHEGTRITLRGFAKYQTRGVNIQGLRRALARRFSIIGPTHDFALLVNGSEITPDERDMIRLLDRDSAGKPYLWTFDDVEIVPESGWKVSGWVGALDRTKEIDDPIHRGITIMARGKLVQEPFAFNATVGQQYALSYIVGELTAEFVDAAEDTVGTTRTSLVWDSEAMRLC